VAIWSVLNLQETTKLRLDPEYYEPNNLDLAKKLAAVQPAPIESFAFVTDGIHASPDWVEEEGITYLSAKCVKDNYFVLTSAGQISQEQNEANPRTQARVGDVLLTTVGTIGNAAVVEEDILPANMDRHLGIIRIAPTANVDPYYLATFLNCQFGRFQTLREATGNVQLNLFIDKIKKLLVPIGEEYNIIGELTYKSYRKRKESELIYADAERVLLDEIGLSDIDLTPQTTYIANFSEIAKANRIDAEYFQPKYYRLFSAINNCGYNVSLLESLIEPIRNGIDYREFVDEGTPYLRVGDVRNGRIDIDNAEKIPVSKEFVRKNVGLEPGDLLFTRKGTFGNAAVVRHEQSHSIISSEIMLLRLLDQAPILPDYLALFLNSTAGYQQIERRVHGVAFYSISQPDLAKTRIVVLPIPTQEVLTDKVYQSLNAEREAKLLLARAKYKIEQLILNASLK
jgi:restriction endonuclease S subunit